MHDVCICVLAHNEQRHIANTLRSLVAESDYLSCKIIVYANGCTDNTVSIVQKLSCQFPQISVNELDVASKANAWNIAFTENDSNILIFSDGDVRPEEGAIFGLCEALTHGRTKIVVAGCTLWPDFEFLGIEQKFVGFLQLPLYQDFLSGGLYAIDRKELMSILQHYGIKSLPVGLVGEDTFLEKIVPSDQFVVITHKVYYIPPLLNDYFSYIARLQWQKKQIHLIMNEFNVKIDVKKNNLITRFILKIRSNKSIIRMLLGLVSVCARYVLVLTNRRKIMNYYIKMGPPILEGSSILSRFSRSNSVK